MKSILFLSTFIFCVISSSYCQQTNTKDSSVLTSDSVSLYLKVSGKGTPCIFVHGGPGAWSRSFEAMGGNSLEKHLTMYYYDQRGCGRSQSPRNNDYSLDRMIEDIENIRVLSGSDKVYLLGHSFGGILAFKYAEKYPTHVKGLVLLNATLYINNSLRSQIRFINQLLGENVAMKNDDSIMQSFFIAKELLNKKQLAYKMLSDNKAAIEKLDSIDAIPRNYSFGQHAFGIHEYLNDFTTETARVNIPVLVISGTEDHNIGPDHYKLFRFPNQQTKIIKGGHVLYYEKNNEFAETVFRFIK
ncbi:proline iminopeptidase [Chitinophaga sp. CF118]|uniref:alpha/beta fold hydrolase n=1 Tax=Chitinophaga sp. CF118 TaxID=1884367 RepID=UPI0008EC2B7A|nr:alpha/beta hydrolase [Chitinophaga sp. CF118]SFD15434.1 proline iminopeptidase [Chitinophaga sp. CF118]